MSLALFIKQNQCQCGNQWVHSQSILYLPDHSMGGTPTPKEESEGRVLRIFHSQRNHSHCFRCVDLTTVRT